MTTQIENSSFSDEYERRYQTAKEMYFGAVEKQYSYGKWLIASLLAVHAGSLLAISQAGEATASLYRECGPLLIYGVAVTLISGGLAWINFSVAANVYASAMQDLRDRRNPSITRVKRVLVFITFWITPVVVTGSLVLFLLAAIKATAVL